MATAAGIPTQLTPRARVSLEREAFTQFPYALLVLDARGQVVCHNREAARLIEAAGMRSGTLTCCELLGCRRAGTALEGECIAELALGRGGALPELRVDLLTPSGASPMWLAAAAVGTQRTQVVLQLRPGVLGDRRRRSGSSWASGAKPLRIRALGHTAVDSVEGSIGGAWLDQRTGQLLKYLIAERRRAATVDQIGESIWPGADYAVGTSVRYYIHALRRQLEPQRGSREPSAYIASRCGTYRLRLENVEVDADEFETHIGAGLSMLEDDQRAAIAEIERGLALYRGDFLADLPYAEWAMPERHRLHDLACIALRRLADVRLELRDMDGAVRALERLAALQPFDEDVHRRLMELDIMRGRRSDAVRRYAALRSRIRRTFGHEPNFTPADLAPPRL
jgi:DNA-binding SARP family transcriptional activator